MPKGRGHGYSPRKKQIQFSSEVLKIMGCWMYYYHRRENDHNRSPIIHRTDTQVRLAIVTPCQSFKVVQVRKQTLQEILELFWHRLNVESLTVKSNNVFIMVIAQCKKPSFVFLFLPSGHQRVKAEPAWLSFLMLPLFPGFKECFVTVVCIVSSRVKVLSLCCVCLFATGATHNKKEKHFITQLWLLSCFFIILFSPTPQPASSPMHWSSFSLLIFHCLMAGPKGLFYTFMQRNFLKLWFQMKGVIDTIQHCIHQLLVPTSLTYVFPGTIDIQIVSRRVLTFIWRLLTFLSFP